MSGGQAPATLPTLGKRSHVRILVPEAVRVYANVRTPTAVQGTARGVVADISAGGVAVHLIEGGRFELPARGGEAEVEIDYEGEEATVTGRVVRVSAQDVSLAFPPMPGDAELNLELLQVIASVATRRVELVDRRGAGATARRLTHRHFYGAGYLDLRVQTAEPAWWQAVFLEYMATWSARDGLVTGTIDRSFSAERASDPLVVQPSVTLHAAPWPKLRKLAAAIATRCAAALPGHADAFELIRATAAPR